MLGIVVEHDNDKNHAKAEPDVTQSWWLLRLPAEAKCACWSKPRRSKEGLDANEERIIGFVIYAEGPPSVKVAATPHRRTAAASNGIMKRPE